MRLMAFLLRFAMAFYMGFGLDVYGYRTISDALLSLFQVCMTCDEL